MGTVPISRAAVGREDTPKEELDPNPGRWLTITVNDRWYQIPTIVDGKQRTDEEAAQLAMQGKNWGKALEGPPPKDQLNQKVGQANQPNLDSVMEGYVPPGSSSILRMAQAANALELPNSGPDNPMEDPSRANSIQRMAMGVPSIEASGSDASVNSIQALAGIQPEVVSPKKFREMVEGLPTEKVSTTTDPFEAALMPIREYGKIQRKHAKESAELVESGWDDLSDPGFGSKALGVGKMAIGALGYTMAPITAAEQALAGDPVRRVGGPELVAQGMEMGLDVAAFGGVRSINNLLGATVRQLGTATGKSQFQILNKLSTILEGLTPREEGMKFAQEAMKGEGAANVLKELTKRWDPDTPLPPRMVAKIVNDALPESQKFGGWWGNIWEKIDLGVNYKFIPTKEGKKSFPEIMQPAVDRLEKSGLDRPFRLASAKRQLAMTAGKDLGKELEGLSPVERLDVIRGLKGEKTTTEEGKRVVGQFRSQIKDYSFGAEYRKHFNNNLMTHLGSKEWKELDDPILRPYVDDLLRNIEVKGTKPGEIMASMLKLIAHPNTPDDTRAILGTLYNLPATTPLAVAEAAKQSSRATMIAGLARRGAIADTQMGADWIQVAKEGRMSLPKTATSGMAGKWVPRDVWLEMKAEEDVAKFAHQMLNKYFMSPWKTSKVVLRPATHIRNIVSNFILNDLGGLPVYRVDLYKKAYDEIKGQGKLFKEFRNMTGSGGTFSANDIAQVGDGLKLHKVGKGWERASMPERILSSFDSMVAKPREVYNAEEQLFKVAKYIHNKEKGMDKYDAAIDAMKWTFNYGEVTRATAAIRSNLMPFFTYQSKVLPLMAKVARENPMRLGKWFGAFAGMQYAGLQAMGMSEREYQNLNKILPDYIADSQFLLLPTRDANGRMQMLNLTYMIPGFGDINEALNNPLNTALSNPLWSIAEGLKSGKNYNGAPLWYDWEDPATKVAKGAEFVWKQIMPSWAGVPGIKALSGQDNIWETVNKWYENHPDAPTAGQIIGGQLGFKVKGLDPAKVAKTHDAYFKVQMSELQRQMVKEIREAGMSGKSGPQISQIANNYQMLRQKLIQGPSERWGPTAQISKLVD